MTDNEMTELEYQQQRVKREDRKARKLRKKMERRALLLGEDLAGARREAEKRLRRQARKQRQAFRDLGQAAIAALRD